ncbi:histone-lysine N-methyltransferase SUV39H2-like [Lytechinus variegatus]|uniref:histone-lysine N-methyltransferase SUV39H2-like n=1 Tax=Lytechinus variegatus TaxID=7654 RepID=UPI001BB2A230|nr:histone-lysine N-methyltransferase SUV39H2-like [Lytechinus variegatus]
MAEGCEQVVCGADKSGSSGDEFEVEEIVDYQKDSNNTEWYLVKWVGYPSTDNTWEPKKNLGNSKKLLKKFHKNYHKACLTRTEILKQKRQLARSLKQLAQKKRSEKWKESESKLLTDVLKSLVKKELKSWEQELNSKCQNEAPITVVNNVDLEGPPQDFVYINDYIAGTGVDIPTDPPVGCECENCSPEAESRCCPQNGGVKFAYSKNKLVKAKPGTPIYECNTRCKCGEQCPNRVVQLGRKHKLVIFRTDNGRGWGVKTLVDIKKNSFVMEYVGEVITSEEAERRGKIYDANGRTYLFDLDYNDDDCPFTVDAGHYGNISHFVNHSCEPNLVVYGVWVNCLDPRLPRIALFACSDIKAGEEITFDYQMTGSVNEEGANELAQVECRCGSTNCRGFLFE